jgi:UDP-GlcNAc3NAcA epimerase
MRIATVVGNRPQLVKAAAVCAALRRRHEEILIHTGQHYDDGLSGVFFDELELPRPDRQLGLGGASNTTQTARMLLALEAELRALAPDAVLVYGDTNTTLAGALAAAQQGLAVIHVEAGMRCFDRTMPEEINRVVVDQLSALCLCSTEVAVANLAREAVPGTVALVGDVMADIALRCADLARARSTILAREQLPVGGYLLATAHRAANVDDPQRLRALVGLLTSLPLPTILPLHPRTFARLREQRLLERLQAAEHVLVRRPIGYLDLLALLAHARAVVTDSGGMQKEAYVLGTPCLTLRDRTEWTETVQSGWNTLVDLDAEAVREALTRTPPPQRPDLYRAGRAVSSLLAAIDDWAGERCR